MKNKGKKDNNNSVFAKTLDFASSLQLKGSFSPEEARAFALGFSLKDGNIIPFEEALEVARGLRVDNLK